MAVNYLRFFPQTLYHCSSRIISFFIIIYFFFFIFQGTKRKLDKANQVNLQLSTVHKRTQVNLRPSTVNQETQTSPIKNRSGSWTVKEKKRFKEDNSESELEKTLSQSSDKSWHPSHTSQSSSQSSQNSTKEELLSVQLKTIFVDLNVKLMEKYPKRYLGIPKDKLGLIEVLITFSKCTKMNIYRALRKIRKNESLDDLADVFGVSKTAVSKSINNTIPELAACLSTYIIWPPSNIIKSNLPASFRINYANVETIIDCFEIFITRPSDPVTQALVYSEYKHHHTMKYLISVTPDGLINFISKGYGGRATDVQIVKTSGYLDHLKPGMVVMTDRGFKELAPILIQKKCTLVKPPSVKQGVKLNKNDARVAKIVASLRMNVERVIGRIREFHLFYAPPFHHNLLHLADQSVTIGCALANVQNPLYV